MMLNRSLLFVPADKEKMLLKINQLTADIIIVDLEDAVAPDHKQISRSNIQNNIYHLKKPVFIRVNDMKTSAFQEDMKLIKEISNANFFEGVMLPKSSSEMDIQMLTQHLENGEKQNNSSRKLSIIPLIESALGVKKSYEIATSNHRILRLAFGGVDFTNDIGAEVTTQESELWYARSEIVVSSRCANIGKPIDTVYTNFKDSDGFHTNCLFAKSLGFAGKLLIHPSQIGIANKSFAPTEEQINFSKRLVSESLKTDGSFQLDGKMIDKPVIKKAQRILHEYELIQEKS